MCYSYREYQMERDVRKQRAEDERRRREERAEKAKKTGKERELVKA